jgi:hypothetical protein
VVKRAAWITAIGIVIFWLAAFWIDYKLGCESVGPRVSMPNSEWSVFVLGASCHTLDAGSMKIVAKQGKYGRKITLVEFTRTEDVRLKLVDEKTIGISFRHRTPYRSLAESFESFRVKLELVDKPQL